VYNPAFKTKIRSNSDRLIVPEAGSSRGRLRCLSGGEAVEQEYAKDAGKASEQTSNPNGTWSNIVIEESADDGREGACHTPAQPVDGHVAAAQVGGCSIGHVFAGGGNEGEFAEGEDDHTEPETPEASHKGNTSGAQRVDQHARANNGQSFMAACDAGDKILNEDTHERVGSGNPAILCFGDTEVGFGIHRHENPEQGRRDQAKAD
jgi:hypothetical protein